MIQCSFDWLSRQNILLSKCFHCSVFDCLNNLTGRNAVWTHYRGRQQSMSHQSTETSGAYVLHGEIFVEHSSFLG